MTRDQQKQADALIEKMLRGKLAITVEEIAEQVGIDFNDVMEIKRDVAMELGADRSYREACCI